MNNATKGFVLGAVGSLAGLAAMHLYWKAADAVHGHDADDHEKAADPSRPAGRESQTGEDATDKVGRAAYHHATGDEPDESRKEKLSCAVHCSYAMLAGGAYGAVRGAADPPDFAGGIAFGSLLWTAGDEVALPLLGLNKGPKAYPLSQHAHRFGAHLAFGMATAAATQFLYAIFGDKPTKKQMLMEAGKKYLQFKAVKAAGEKVMHAIH